MNPNESQKIRRQKLKDQGLCVQCGKHPPRDGLLTCEPCGKKLSENMSRWKQKAKQERQSSGLCSCGKPVEKGKTCKECKQKNRAWYYRKKNMAQCTYCGNAAMNGKTRCEECSKDLVKKNRELKLEVYEAYGGAVCKCCGESTEQFLTIDHINDDGAEHRKQIGRTSILRWLKQNDYPEGFQVLCFNCNLGRRINGGICPHKT